MKRIAIYPGSFDPVTNGHLDILKRGLKLFDTIIIAILQNPGKEELFTVKERVGMLKESTRDLENIEIVYIPFDESLLGGAVIHDRAVWLCDEYGVDALLMTELDDLEIAGGEISLHTSRVIRIQVKLESKLLEGTGGSIFWSGDFESNEMHEAYELDLNRDLVLKADIHSLIQTMVDDLDQTGSLDGGHVD